MSMQSDDIPPEERIAALKRETAAVYGADVEEVMVVRSPYRICPLGAHIDHQLGPVTGMALEHELLFAFVPRDERTIRAASKNFEGETYIDLGQALPARQDHWSDYLRGAVYALQKKFGPLRKGLDGIVSGDSRIGGLSSSSSVGCAYLLALEAANAIEATPEENIELDRIVENEYVGLRNGILDQSTILLSKRRHLTHIDCKTGDYELLHLPDSAPPVTIVIAFSGLTRKLVGTDYNRRVEQCRNAAHALKGLAGLELSDNPPLGAIPPEVFEAHLEELPEPLRKRARHFHTESERVKQGVEFWKNGKIEEFGRLMTESGRSSIVNYECGGPELISLYEIMIDLPGIYGARFSGAGFRGCCIGLADPAAAPDIASGIMAAYSESNPEAAPGASVFFCGSADGASVLTSHLDG